MNQPLKVLFQARSDLHQNPGGDSVLLLNVCEHLRASGINVDIDIDGSAKIRNYDLIHLYNFATPDAILPYAKRAVDEGVPYVVTTLYEDRAEFYQQMHVFNEIIMEYIRTGQSAEWKLYEEICIKHLKKNSTDIIHKNQFIANNAKVLISSGLTETALLKRDFPNAPAYTECQFASTSLPLVSKKLFENTFGVSDYILCVGRIEYRKNQGMLLAALENDPRTLVFVGGKISHNPYFEIFLRKFRRKGKTIFLKNLSPEMLSSAYAGARVHALPSWYELPGLVTLEAARAGCNVVASKGYGSIEDYLGEHVFYCKPDNSQSIYEAIEKAWDSPNSWHSKRLSSSYTWERNVSRLHEIYIAAITDNCNYNSIVQSVEGPASSSTQDSVRELELDATTTKSINLKKDFLSLLS